LTEDIRRKTEKSIASMFLSTMGTRVVHAVTTVILMRLMGPDQFGIIGFAVIFKEMILLFSSWGIGDAVIQKKGGKGLMASALVLSTIRSTAFFLALFVAAPFAASFFSTPEVSLVVRISALMLLLSPLQFLPRLKMSMDLRFTALSVISLFGALVNSTVAIAAAFSGMGYLAIVYGNVAGTLAGLAGSLIAQPMAADPRKASIEGMKEIMGFGYHLTLSGIVSWIYLNIDDLIVGKLLGKTVLGLYTKAYWLATLPGETLGRILYTVTFPAYCKVKDDLEKLRKAFLEVYTMNVFISVPAVVGILVLSNKIVPIVFGSEWVPMIGILELTCAVGMLRAVYGQANSIFKAVGRPDYYWKAALVQAGIVVTLGLWATRVWGVYGMLGSLVVAMSWGFVVYGYLAFKRVLNIPVLEYLLTLKPILASTVIMGLLAWMLRRLATDLLSLIFVVVLSALFYFVSVYLTGGQDIIHRTYKMGKRVAGRE